MSVFPAEQEPLNNQGVRSWNPTGSTVSNTTVLPNVDSGSDSDYPNSRGTFIWRNRSAVLLLGLIAIGLLRGGFLGWQDYSPVRTSKADVQNKIGICKQPKGMCTEMFINELSVVSNVFTNSHKKVQEDIGVVSRYAGPLEGTCLKVKQMTKTCDSLKNVKDELPEGSFIGVGLQFDVQPKRGAPLLVQHDQNLGETVAGSYAALVAGLAQTATDIQDQCSAVGAKIKTGCNGLSSLAEVAGGKSLKDTYKLLQSDAKELVKPAQADGKKNMPSNELIKEAENKLKADKVDLKKRLADDLEAKLESYKRKTEIWKEKKIAEDLAAADAKYEDQVMLKDESQAAVPEETKEKLMEKSKDELAEAIAKAKEENDKKKAMDKVKMETQIAEMKKQYRAELENEYTPEVGLIKKDGNKKLKQMLDEATEAKKKYLEEYKAQVEEEEESTAKDEAAKMVAQANEKYKDMVRIGDKEAKEKLASDKKKYQEALVKEGNYMDITVESEDYMKVWLENDPKKREQLIEQTLEKKFSEMEKETQQKLNEFNNQAEDEKNQAIQDAEQKFVEKAKQNVKSKIAEAEKMKDKDIQSLQAKMEADIQAKIQNVAIGADDDIDKKVEKAEKALREKITKINDGTYDEHLDDVKETFSTKADKVLNDGIKEAKKQAEHAEEERKQKAKLLAKHAKKAAPGAWADQAKEKIAVKQQKLEKEYDAELESETWALEEASAKKKKQFQELQEQYTAERQVPEILAFKIKESVKTANVACQKLADIKQHCLQFHGASITDNEALMDRFDSFCREAQIFKNGCDATYSDNRWPSDQDFVSNMKQAHGIAAAGSLWLDTTADALETCNAGDKKGNAGDKKGNNTDDKDRRRLEDKPMQDVEGKCEDLSKEAEDSIKVTRGKQDEIIESAKTTGVPTADTVKQRIIQDDVALKLKVSKDAALNSMQRLKNQWDDLMGEVSDRIDGIPKGCADVVYAAKEPCQKLPPVWDRYRRSLADSDYFLDSVLQWVAGAKGACEQWKNQFTECVTRLHANQGPGFDELSLAQTLQLENIVQPVLRSIQIGLVLTCIFIYFSHKSANRLLTASVCTSQVALFYLVIVSMVRGCLTVALGFTLCALAAAHWYHKIQPNYKFVSLALQCAASALEGTLGIKAWVAMIGALLFQAVALLLSLGAALHLQGHCGWPLIPAVLLPLIAGVWTAEVIACMFRSVVGSAVFLMALEGSHGDFASSAVEAALGGEHGVGSIAAWALASALPFRCGSSVSAVDSLEIMLPQQGESGLGHSRAFSDALRIIRLALASVLSIVALGAPTGSIGTAVVAMTAVLMGHAFAAVPVYSLEASLFGFASAVEEVGGNTKTNCLEELLAQVVVKRIIGSNTRNMLLLDC